MGLFDSLSSTKRPPAGTPVLPRQQLLANLRSLNRPTAPYRIIDGVDEKVDLIAEWRIVSAHWYEIYAKAALSKVFRISLKLDKPAHVVRALDREYSLTWSAGVPKLTVAASALKGQVHSLEFGKVFAFTGTFETGDVYKYSFDTREIKTPIQDTVAQSGWICKGVTFGKL